MSYNYYDLLEIEPGATTDELTKAFRKLALKYHPDKNVDAGDKFKDVAKAYKILSDPETRKVYDTSGEEGVELHSGTAAFDSENFTWADFERLFWKFDLNKRRTKDVKEIIDVSLEDIYVGVNKKVTVKKFVLCEGCKDYVKDCSTCKGYGDTCDNRCEECQGIGYIDESPQHCYKCEGTKVVPRMANYSIEIKPGTYNGQHIPILGEGNEEPGCLPGDRVFVVKTIDHHLYQRVTFLDLATEVFITSAQKHARGGHDIILPSLDGSEMTIHLPEGVANGRTIEIPNSGLPDYFVPSKRGKLIVTIRKMKTTGSEPISEPGVKAKEDVKRSSSFKRFDFMRNSFRGVKGKRDSANRKSMPDFRKVDVQQLDNVSMEVDRRSLNETVDMDFVQEEVKKQSPRESITIEPEFKAKSYSTLPVQSKLDKPEKKRRSIFGNSFRRKEKRAPEVPIITSTPEPTPPKVEAPKLEKPVKPTKIQEAPSTPKRKSKGFLTSFFFR